MLKLVSSLWRDLGMSRLMVWTGLCLIAFSASALGMLEWLT